MSLKICGFAFVALSTVVMAAFLSVVSASPSTAIIDMVISSVLWRSIQVMRRWSLSLFHSKKRSSRTSFFHTSAGMGGRVTQFGVLLWEGVADRARVLRWFCEPSSLSPTGRLKPELVCMDTSPTAGMGLAGAVVCCAWDGRREEDCFVGDGVAGGYADVPCRAADGSVTERGFHGSCCALNLSNQSLNVATDMAAAAVCSTSRIRWRAGWNSS